jgi:hypothetical protein
MACRSLAFPLRAPREHGTEGDAPLDAESLELHADPGPHRIVGVHAGARAALAIFVREGSAEDLELRFPELPPRGWRRAQRGVELPSRRR